MSYESKHAGKDFIKIANNNSNLEILKNLSELGQHYNVTFGTDVLLKFEEKRGEFESFISDNERNKILKYASGLTLGSRTIINLMENKTQKYLHFFEEKQNQANIELLKKRGYGFREFFELIQYDYDRSINDPDFLILLNEFSNKKIEPENTAWYLVYLKQYYDIEKNYFKLLAGDLKKIGVGDLGNSIFEIHNKEKLEKSTNLFKKISTSYSESDPERFSEDPALNIINKLGYYDRMPNYISSLDDKNKTEWIVRVARNMYMSKIPVTPENFEQTYYETLNLRMDKELLEKDLFKDRNVALFAHNEELYQRDTTLEEGFKKSDDRFGKQAVQVGISKQKPTNLTLFRTEDNEESLKNTKKSFLNYIKNHSSLTVVFDAHGDPDGISFTGNTPPGYDEMSGLKQLDVLAKKQVSFEELASAFEKRYDNGFTDIPILILDVCFNQNFIRNLNEQIVKINDSKHKKIPLPIAAGVSEYGQPGFSYLSNAYGSIFLQLILENKNETKLKDIIEIEAANGSTGMESNISLFVPFTKEGSSEKNKKIKQRIFYQIAQTEETPLNKTFALQYANMLMDNKLDDKTASYYEFARPEQAHEIKRIIDESESENIA
ncbi:MAG: hypothetical protein US50_C0021G0004 [Candidatus Nomurabacteria bacterium GW2011_GWB1_37_5]|uniref:Uncharacterized protein n=1 Tax=Candidatus Nomurabacteria bacterium GW2011_GWB1_37_5 TaxID=1618742 RepID=A0A0G0H9L0_9BACT|nr:MAG: hypothetical protein US50_C0021G0004 [Candidatus Nomurabacteria bacterium GW2011_GWB1_37_5]